MIDLYYRNEFNGMIHDWYYWSRNSLTREAYLRDLFRYMWE